MTREKFPEKIPFRLTRMLTNAMEVHLVTLIFVLSAGAWAHAYHNNNKK